MSLCLELCLPSLDMAVKTASSDGWTSREDMATLDILAGDLTPGLLTEVRAWTRIYLDELMFNWNRCQSGAHPFVLG